MKQQADVIVLGAGMAGVSAALALQARGRAVAIIERRERPGSETSYGNAGLIERASVTLYTFPRDVRTILKTLLGRNPQARIDWAHIAQTLPWIVRYYRESSRARAAEHALAALPLIENCLAAHEALAVRANALELFRHTGWLKAFRSEKSLEKGALEARHVRQYGLKFDALDANMLATIEPHAKGFVGAVHFLDPVSVVDPGALVRAYAELFIRCGGKILSGDARSLEQSSGGWSVKTKEGALTAPDVVLALGPWSDEVFMALGYKIPLGVKRGYHMHYAAANGAVLHRPLLDFDGGFLLAPMRTGIRLTTGAEFAPRAAPSSPIQLDQLEPLARKTFPLAQRLDAAPWMGARPCLPDLLPVIGPAPRHKGFWFNFGHQHHGFTLGPIAGELLAEMMMGVETFANPEPFRVERFN